MGSDGLTNKELMLQMFELSKSTAVQMTEMNTKIESIEKKVDQHEEILKNIPIMAENIKAIKNNSDKLEDKLDRSISKSIKSDDAIRERIDKLEKKSGENALAAWKKIGVIVLTIVVTSVVNGLISYFTHK